MTTLQHAFLIISALLGLLGVAAGAFGVHLLKSRLSSDSFIVFEVAVRYQEVLMPAFITPDVSLCSRFSLFFHHWNEVR